MLRQLPRAGPAPHKAPQWCKQSAAIGRHRGASPCKAGWYCVTSTHSITHKWRIATATTPDALIVPTPKSEPCLALSKLNLTFLQLHVPVVGEPLADAPAGDLVSLTSLIAFTVPTLGVWLINPILSLVDTAVVCSLSCCFFVQPLDSYSAVLDTSSIDAGGNAEQHRTGGLGSRDNAVRPVVVRWVLGVSVS